MKNTMLEAALSYAAKGYFVFPCKVRSKHPATEHGFKDATRDEETLLRACANRRVANASTGNETTV
jgi:hypothetical protein